MINMDGRSYGGGGGDRVLNLNIWPVYGGESE